MGQYKAEAILLAVREHDDASRMVTLFSREHGKFSAIAYGARRQRSALAGCIQPFTHADLALMSGRSVDSIKQCEIIRSFRELRENLASMAYASLLSELTAELWPEREAEPLVFDLLLAAFDLLGKRNPRITALAGAVQLLALAGFRPELDNCVVCNQPLALPAVFDAMGGGGACAACGQPHFPVFGPEAKVFVEKLLNLDWRNPGQFSVTGAVLTEAERLLADFLTYRLEKPLKSMAFIAAIS